MQCKVCRNTNRCTCGKQIQQKKSLKIFEDRLKKSSCAWKICLLFLKHNNLPGKRLTSWSILHSKLLHNSNIFFKVSEFISPYLAVPLLPSFPMHLEPSVKNKWLNSCILSIHDPFQVIYLLKQNQTNKNISSADSQSSVLCSEVVMETSSRFHKVHQRL